jgi:hypothetical protein
MNEKEPIKQSLYVSCKTCSEVASWVPHKEGGEWECQACRTGTRQFGRAEREKYLRGKISPEERREQIRRMGVSMIAFAFGAWITWEVFRFLSHVQ